VQKATPLTRNPSKVWNAHAALRRANAGPVSRQEGMVGEGGGGGGRRR